MCLSVYLSYSCINLGADDQSGPLFCMRCNIYISHLCYDVSVHLSVCDGSALRRNTAAAQPAKLKPSYDPQQTWPLPMQGSSRAMLATARPSFQYLKGRCTATNFGEKLQNPLIRRSGIPKRNGISPPQFVH